MEKNSRDDEQPFPVESGVKLAERKSKDDCANCEPIFEKNKEYEFSAAVQISHLERHVSHHPGQSLPHRQPDQLINMMEPIHNDLFLKDAGFF